MPITISGRNDFGTARAISEWSIRIGMSLGNRFPDGRSLKVHMLPLC